MSLQIQSFVLLLVIRSIAVGEEVHSEAVSLGNGDYKLVYSEDHEFNLVKTANEATVTSRRPLVQPSLRPILSQSEKVRDIAMSRWGAFSLVGVVHSRSMKGDCFTFITIIRPESDSNPVTVHTAEAFRCEPGYRILALSGGRRGEELVLLVGRRSPEVRGNVISSGKIVIHGCPYPSPVDAEVVSFTTIYEQRVPIQEHGVPDDSVPEPFDKIPVAPDVP